MAHGKYVKIQRMSNPDKAHMNKRRREIIEKNMFIDKRHELKRGNTANRKRKMVQRWNEYIRGPKSMPKMEKLPQLNQKAYIGNQGKPSN